MDKCLAVAETKEELNALFGVLDETASSSVGNKIGNLLTGKHNVNSKIFYERFTKMSALYEAKQAELSDTIKPRKDHPRVCGEKETMLVNSAVIVGSPPRMRGKDHILEFIKNCNRITPAYAGKSVIGEGDVGVRQDHPRVCGEKSRRAIASVVSKGSPPRMRGKAQTSQKCT